MSNHEKETDNKISVYEAEKKVLNGMKAYYEQNLSYSELEELAGISIREFKRYQKDYDYPYRVGVYNKKGVYEKIDSRISEIDKEIQDLVAVLRKQPAETRSSTLLFTSMILQMQTIEEELQEMPQDAEFPVDKAKEFYNAFLPFSLAINEMSRKYAELQQKFEDEFRVRGIDFP